jgi:PAS domain S-box-containing protein
MIEDITRYPERYSTNVNENVRRDGERVWMSWTNRAILDRYGNLVEVLSVGNDITAQKRAEDALRKSEASMLKAQQMARLGNWELDLRSNEMSGSDETFRMFEIDPKATHSSEAFMNRFAPGERERMEAAMNAAIHEGKPYNIDHRILLPCGVERIMHSEGELVRDAEGRPVSMFGVVHDITDRLRAEKALEESEEKYRGIVETANEGIWVMDADARTVFVNQRMADMLGYAVEEMARKTLFEFIYPEEAGVAEINWDQVKGGGMMRLDFRFRRKDGQPLWTIFSAAPLRDKAGSPNGYLGMLMDITERKHAEAKLIESEADLKWAQRIGNIGSWEWDIKRDIEWWSDEAYRIMGMAPGSVKPDFSILIDHVHPDDRIVVKRAMRDALGKKAPFQADYRVVRDGTERHIHSEGEVIFNDKGAPVLMRGIIHDITERKQVEATLAQLASIVVSSNDAIITKTLDGFITGWNAAAERIFGYPAEETIGQPIGIVVPLEREREPYEFLDRIRRGERIVNYETVRVTRDGRAIDVSVTISPITDPLGNITGASTICRDITEHKRLEDQLRVSDKRFKVLVNSSTIGIVIANMDSIVEANDTYLKMTGYTREDLRQGLVSWRKMTPPEYEHRDNRGLIELLEHGSCASYEKEYYRKDGSRIPVLIGRALLEKEPLTWVSYVLDITGRKRTEEELKRQEGEVSTLINNIPDMVMRFDRNLRYTFQSPAVERVSGIPARKFIGRTVAETGQFDQATVASYEAILRHVFETGQAETFEFNATGPPGTQHFLARIVPEYDARGNVASLLDITQDITERKKAEEAVMNSMALAELYMDLMAHDINNMNQVGISNLELALEELADPTDRDVLESALESLKSSSKLIGNVRILQRLMQERIDLGSISLDEALAEAKDTCLQELKKGVTIRANGQGGHVLASDLLKEVFSNIIGNAIKHTPGDVSIDITVNRVFGADEGYFKVAIEDNGPGIPDEAKKKVFSRLTPGKKAKGRGIGLYIVKLLVEEYGGRVWVEDRVPGDHSKGARFVVMLPAAEK